jgi:hypothetical protein
MQGSVIICQLIVYLLAIIRNKKKGSLLRPGSRNTKRSTHAPCIWMSLCTDATHTTLQIIPFIFQARKPDLKVINMKCSTNRSLGHLSWSWGPKYNILFSINSLFSICIATYQKLLSNIAELRIKYTDSFKFTISNNTLNFPWVNLDVILCKDSNAFQ